MAHKKRTKAPKKGQKAKLVYRKDSNIAKMHVAVDKLTAVLRAFCKRTGRKATMHFVDGPGFVPFPKGRDIHFVVGASPTGSIRESDHSHVCGVRVQEKGKYVRFWGPTEGVGTLVKDKEGNLVGQIVNSTVYLFVPTPASASFLFGGREGADMYSRAIKCAWKTMIGKQKRLKVSRIKNADDYRQFIEKQYGSMGRLFDLQQNLIDIRISDTTDKLRTLYAEKETYLRLKTLELAKTEKEKAEAPVRDWERMQKHPLVKRIRSVEGALHLETRRIIAEHEGKYYNFGKFMLRLELGGTPSIWSEHPTHPKRAQHPHISKTGVICFGNIAVPLTQAMGELRMADALELLLDWLREGYDPNLADNKIEEWPKVRRNQRRAA